MPQVLNDKKKKNLKGMEFIVYVKKSRATSSETSKSVAKGGTSSRWVIEFRTALTKNVKKKLLRFHVLQSIYMATDSKDRNKYLFS